MQADWLTRYFRHQHDGACDHTAPIGHGEPSDGEVSRRDFVKTGFVAGVAQDRVYEFAWSFNPLMLKGATGSPGNSVAIA